MIDNRIGGVWVPPASGSYLRLDPSPPTLNAPARVARSGGQDLQLALAAAAHPAGGQGAKPDATAPLWAGGWR